MLWIKYTKRNSGRQYYNKINEVIIENSLTPSINNSDTTYMWNIKETVRVSCSKFIFFQCIPLSLSTITNKRALSWLLIISLQQKKHTFSVYHCIYLNHLFIHSARIFSGVVFLFIYVTTVNESELSKFLSACKRNLSNENEMLFYMRVGEFIFSVRLRQSSS